MESHDKKLDRLFAVYRDATDGVDASEGFEAKVWRGIAQQGGSRWLGLRFDRLLALYRETTVDFQESPQFVPGVWQRIEAARDASWLSPLRVWSTRVAAGAALATGMLVGAVALQMSDTTAAELDDSAYVDALTHDSLGDQEDALWVMAQSR